MVLARLDRGASHPGWRWLHRWLPVLALPWLYDAAGRLRHVLVAHDLDAWIARADAWIFPGRWYLAGARWPLPALELAHAVYFSYYLLLFVPALVVERRRPGERSEVDRYLCALTATLLAHYALNFLLPVAGPLADRARDMPEGALFLPIMDAIYFAFDRGGLAFPSTHVAAAVVAGWFAGRRFFPNAALPLCTLGRGNCGLDRGLRLSLSDRRRRWAPDGQRRREPRAAARATRMSS